MFGQCPIFAYLGLRSILMLCEQVKIGEDGVLAEYLQIICTGPGKLILPQEAQGKLTMGGMD